MVPWGLPVVPSLLPCHPALWWLCWPWALCRLIRAPNFLMQFCPWTHWLLLSCPWTSAPLVLTTYCPPSRHDCNTHFSICQEVSGTLSSGSSGTSCIFLLPAFVPYFLPDCGSCARSPDPHRVTKTQQGKAGISLVLVAGYPHNCCRGNVELEQCFPFQQATCSLSLPETS